MKKTLYDPAMAEHLAYVQRQRHTRGDMARAVRGFNGHEAKKAVKGDVHVSNQLHTKNSFDRGTVGNTRYVSIGGEAISMGPRTCRVCKNS